MSQKETHNKQVDTEEIASFKRRQSCGLDLSAKRDPALELEEKELSISRSEPKKFDYVSQLNPAATA